MRSQGDAFPAHSRGTSLAVWLQDAGYDTGVIGKYFTASVATGSPSGWNTRRQLVRDNQRQHGYSVWDGSTTTEPSIDQARYLRSEAVSFLQTAREPFFLWFTPTANHWPYEVPPGYEEAAATLQWPDLREADVSDKPQWIQALPAISEESLSEIRFEQRRRVQELLALDDTLDPMFDILEARGSLDNTLVMFTSDNGLLQGEHRLRGSKNMPYEPSVRVPCYVRGPDFPVGECAEPVHMALDLTATCVEVAGARPDLALDGVSLRAAVSQPERYEDRRLLYERDNRDDGAQLECPPADGVFTKTRKLVRYASEPPTYELYDLTRDPAELQNVADDPAYAGDRSDLVNALDELLAL